MLVEEIIDANLSDDLSNPKIIQLGKSLSKKEKDILTTILKEKKSVFLILHRYA